MHDAAYGGNSRLSKWSDTHRADVDLARENDRVPIWRQCKLELVEENKIQAPSVVRCGNKLCRVDGSGVRAMRKQPLPFAKLGSFHSRMDRATISAGTDRFSQAAKKIVREIVRKS